LRFYDRACPSSLLPTPCVDSKIPPSLAANLVNKNEETMRAVGYRKSLPIDDPQSLMDIEIDKPAPQGRDLLVQVKAISVNPVDYKVRRRAAPKDGEPAKILGYDATGVVAATGPQVTLFKTGEEVWY